MFAQDTEWDIFDTDIIFVHADRTSRRNINMYQYTQMKWIAFQTFVTIMSNCFVKKNEILSDIL